MNHFIMSISIGTLCLKAIMSLSEQSSLMISPVMAVAARNALSKLLLWMIPSCSCAHCYDHLFSGKMETLLSACDDFSVKFFKFCSIPLTYFFFIFFVSSEAV